MSKKKSLKGQGVPVNPSNPRAWVDSERSALQTEERNIPPSEDEDRPKKLNGGSGRSKILEW